MTDYEIVRQHLKKGEFYEPLTKPYTRSFGGQSAEHWMIQGKEGLLAYDRLVQKIYKLKDVQNNYTIKDVEKVLDSLLLEGVDNGTASQEDIVKKARSNLPSDIKQSFDIARNIYGITLSKNYRKLKPYVFQKRENTYKAYFRGHPWKDSSLKESMSPFVVRFRVEAVSNARAIEAANDSFDFLEHLFAFLIGSKESGFEVRIFRQTREHMLFHIAKREDGEIIGAHARENMVHRDVDLNNVFFQKPNIRRLFELVPTKQRNKIESRLSKAIIWVGKGLFSSSSIETIICCCSALESLLVRESGSIISPSIVASLSEYCAILLGNSVTARMKIINNVKDIYKERSAGTHGGKVTADKEIEKIAILISKSMVYRLLDLYPKIVSTEKDLINYVQRIKYS